MTEHKSDLVLHHPQEKVFDFIEIVENLLNLLPADGSAQIIEAPEKLHADAEVEVKVSVMGMSQTLRTRVIEFQRSEVIVSEQIRGPFRAMRQTVRLESLGPEKTSLLHQVEFEPPGGVLGFVATEERILKLLRSSTLQGLQRVKEALESADA
ncbi:MAG: hypothetical protein N2C14_03430 [Planctomycetales bacterium]